MKLPSGVHFRSELGLLLWKPTGLLSEKTVNAITAFVGEQEALSDATQLRFIDTTALTAVELNFRYVFHVALYRRLSRQGRPPIRSAFLVREPALEHYFKLHAILTDRSPLHVRLFDNEATAAKWLDVPVESLQTD